MVWGGGGGNQLDGLGGGNHVVWEGTTCIMSSSGREVCLSVQKQHVMIVFLG